MTNCECALLPPEFLWRSIGARTEHVALDTTKALLLLHLPKILDSQSGGGSIMYILGVNGWNKRSHDSAVALIKDNEVIACIEEERLSRSRHAFEQIPHRSIQFCLDQAGITANDIDVLAIGWDYHKKYRDRGMSIPIETLDLVELYLPAVLFGRTRNPELDIHEHHKAHAASVYHLSDVADAAVLVLDGQGETESTSFWRGHASGHLERIASFPIGASLGYFYEAVNMLLGFHNLDSGKTMGLAPYGSPIESFDDLPKPENICPHLATFRKQTFLNDTFIYLFLLTRASVLELPPQVFNSEKRQKSPYNGLFMRELNTRTMILIASSEKKEAKEPISLILE